jgi:hypothetical protein
MNAIFRFFSVTACARPIDDDSDSGPARPAPKAVAPKAIVFKNSRLSPSSGDSS